MRKITLLPLICLVFFLCSANRAIAQRTGTPNGQRPTQEQSLQELVNEVRQLRADLQRINVTMHKTNVVLERLKFQQDLVARLSRDLNDTRESLAEMRVHLERMKEHVNRVESGVERGSKNPEELAALKLEIESATQRELRLAQRETQLMNELSMERVKLAELNDLLTRLELELR